MHHKGKSKRCMKREKICRSSFESKPRIEFFFFYKEYEIERERIITYYQGEQHSCSRPVHMKQTAKTTFIIRLLPISFMNRKLKNVGIRTNTHDIYTNMKYLSNIQKSSRHSITMPEQHVYLTVIMNSVCTNDKNTTNWRGHCKKLVGIVGEILTNEYEKHI